jgi:hypothetical protein
MSNPVSDDEARLEVVRRARLPVGHVPRPSPAIPANRRGPSAAEEDVRDHHNLPLQAEEGLGEATLQGAVGSS